MNFLGACYFKEGNLSEALLLWDDCLERRMRVLGAEHADTQQSVLHASTCRNDMGLALLTEGPHQSCAEAEILFKEVLATRRLWLGEDHEGTLVALGNLAQVHLMAGSFSEARPLFLELHGGDKLRRHDLLQRKALQRGAARARGAAGKAKGDAGRRP